MPDLSTRIKKAALKGQLTVSDLALWFERPNATVRTWIKLNREPAAAKLDETEYRLYKLERAIWANKFPVPYALTQRERPNYIKRVRADELKQGLLAPHLTA